MISVLFIAHKVMEAGTMKFENENWKYKNKRAESFSFWKQVRYFNRLKPRTMFSKRKKNFPNLHKHWNKTIVPCIRVCVP